MMRYMRVLAVFYKAAILIDLEYRANLIINILLSLISGSWSVAGVAVFFLHTDEIGGWRFNELMIVLGLYLFFLGMMDVFVTPNVRDLMQHIRLGTMDFILTKPLNSQFHASLRRLNIWRTVDIGLGLSLVGYSVWRLPVWPAAVNLLLFILLSGCALVILYALIMLVVTSVFWLVQLENVIELLFTFYEAGRFPVNIFPNWMRVLLTFVVPIAFVTTVPVSVLLNRLNGLFALYSLLITVILLRASILFWNYAVRHYSSASS